MARNVRNFWIEAKIDGRNTALSGGPQRKDGGFGLTIYQRDNGSITRALNIMGRVKDDGSIVLSAWNGSNEINVQTTR